MWLEATHQHFDSCGHSVSGSLLCGHFGPGGDRAIVDRKCPSNSKCAGADVDVKLHGVRKSLQIYEGDR